MAKNTYNANQLPAILREMADYLSDNCYPEEYPAYFQDIVKTGLFHDAMGKPVAIAEDSVIVRTDY